MAKVQTILSVDGVAVRRTPRMSVEEYRSKLGLKRLTDFGSEIPDPVPMAPPVGYIKQPSIFENMRALVKAELARKAADEGFDTEEDDNNFDVGEDRDPLSRHEFTELEEEGLSSAAKAHNAALAEHKAARKRELEAAKAGAAKEGQGPAKPASEALDAPEQPAKPSKA